jgi:hypothetical protein
MRRVSSYSPKSTHFCVGNTRIVIPAKAGIQGKN